MQATDIDHAPAYPAGGPPWRWQGRWKASSVSWAAIFAGAAAAAALSLILVMLGFGLGFSVVSPWPSSDTSATAITVTTAIWLALTQIAASGLGGYLAGRLRTQWTDIHNDEVYFRDTAHGMLSWAVATLVTAAFLGSAISGVVGTGAKLAGGAVGAASAVAAPMMMQGGAGADGAGARGSQGFGPMAYAVDSLFRSDDGGTQDPAQAKAEAARVFWHGIRAGSLDAADKSYLAGLVSRTTGLDRTESEQRVDTLYTQAQQAAEEAENSAREAADTARKAAAASALWAFVALLCGAFCASLAAIWGGRRRDLAVLEGPDDRLA